MKFLKAKISEKIEQRPPGLELVEAGKGNERVEI
jgi:hypothetical protein